MQHHKDIFAYKQFYAVFTSSANNIYIFFSIFTRRAIWDYLGVFLIFRKTWDFFEWENFIPFPWRIREVSYWQCVGVSDGGGHVVHRKLWAGFTFMDV